MTEAGPSSLITVQTSRFGQVSVPPENVITLPHGMVGFPDFHRYALIQHRPDSPFHWLQCLDRPDLAFAIISPLIFDRKYEVRLGKAESRLLDADDPTSLQLWSVVTIPQGKPENMTANLKAPVVINLKNRLAAQVILEDPAYSLRAPLPA